MDPALNPGGHSCRMAMSIRRFTNASVEEPTSAAVTLPTGHFHDPVDQLHYDRPLLGPMAAGSSVSTLHPLSAVPERTMHRLPSASSAKCELSHSGSEHSSDSEQSDSAIGPRTTARRLAMRLGSRDDSLAKHGSSPETNLDSIHALLSPHTQTPVVEEEAVSQFQTSSIPCAHDGALSLHLSGSIALHLSRTHAVTRSPSFTTPSPHHRSKPH